ncbi:M23 family metallopeptidase [Paraglaciecola aquimarina]|uniref:M23 family metallopeptidase n=1 Tax=Paraglaciecola aquimarina TaxID=1235557 RepID=A0ABU3SVH6_9ALTE|nr:M23 family metallopeptidase [Paraglaciecola aquimarina]MDU0354028.1 M23 family metallopeptidase [Paraglaciecola aquimarina]
MLKYVWLLLVVLTSHVVAADIKLRGELTQGSLIRGELPPGSQVWLNDKVIKISDAGEFAFGFGRDADLKQSLKWLDKLGQEHSKTLTLTKRTYVEQRIEGVESKYVSPPKSVLDRIKQDNLQVANARKTNDDRTDFTQEFIWPAKGPISGVYGSRRVFNGTPKRPHFGVDVAGPTGTPVHAPADGIVTLWVPDMYYSGGTMIIDHGFGVSSTFIHLSKGHVTAGTPVKQGDLVAEIGATGRVTGPHLDWRINWFNERLDPALLVPKR